MADITLGTLYEANCNLLKTMAPVSESVMKKDFASVGAGMSSHPFNKYYMLMCKERSDFTLFHLTGYNYTNIVQEIREVLEERGTLMGINYVHGENAYECGVRQEATEDTEATVFMFMLFDADGMVVDCGA